MMKRNGVKMAVAAVLVLAVGSGCFRHSYSVGAGGDTSRSPALSKWQHNLLWGLIGGEKVDIDEVCPSGSATVENYFSVLNSIVAAVLGGFWSPTTVEVYCGGGRAENSEEKVKKIVLSVEEQKRIARDERFLTLVADLFPGQVEQVRVALATGTTSPDALVCR